MGEMKRENEMEAISDEDRSRIDEAIEKRRSDIAAVDWDLLNDSVGVRQAEDALRKALDKVSDSLDSGDYQTVAQLGYTDVSSSFVFLQRVMGGMQTNAYKRSDLISQIAMEVGLAYELVEPQAEAAFQKARAEHSSQGPVVGDR